jgi:predicted MFS family arabinose efflux permease
MSSAAFHRVFGAEVISTFGSLMSRLAIPWLAVLVLNAPPTAMALLAVADVAASALAALLLGALVDRWPKRRTMILADLARAAMLFTVPVMALTGGLTIGWLVVVVAVNGALTVAFELAQSAWIARSTARDQLTQRNSALAGGAAVTEAASFGITGWLFQWLGAIVVMIADALTYIASALLLVKIDEPSPLHREAPLESSLRAQARALAAEVRAGLQTTAQQPVLRTLAVVATLVAFATSFASTTYMIYVARDLAFPTGTLGLLFALGGIGSLVASWLTARSAHRIDPRIWLVGSLVLWAIGSAATPLATTAAIAGIALIATQQIVGDAGGMAYHIADRTLRQTHAAPAYLARVDASVRTLGYAATLVGALLSGVLAERYGARALLFASSALIGVAALAAWIGFRIGAQRASSREAALEDSLPSDR